MSCKESSDNTSCVLSVALLRKLFQEDRLGNISEKDGEIHLPGGFTFPKDTKTGFKIHGSDIDGVEDFYTLGNMLNLLRGLAIFRPNDRNKILNFFTESQESISRDLKEPSHSEEASTSKGKRQRQTSESDDETLKRFRSDHKSKIEASIIISNSQDHPDPFNRLSDELMLKILSNLTLKEIATKASLINERFKRLCSDSSLWRDATLAIDIVDGVKMGDDIDHRHCIRLIDRCPQLEKLDLTYSHYGGILAAYALEYCPNLRELEVEICQDFAVLIKAVAKHGRSLRKLVNADVCTTLNRSFDPKLMSIHMEDLSQLTHMDFRFVHDNPEMKEHNHVFWKALARHCKDLEHFVFPAISGLTDEVMDEFLHWNHQKIKTLALEGFLLTDSSLQNLSKCQNLETLVINFANKMESKGLLAISELQNLSHLQLCHGYELTNIDFLKAFNEGKLANLKILFLEGCHGLNDQGLKVIADKCPELTKLSLDNCNNVTPQGLKYILQKCLNLKELLLYRLDDLSIKAFNDIKAPLKKLLLDECFFTAKTRREVLKRNIEKKNPMLKVEIED